MTTEGFLESSVDADPELVRAVLWGCPVHSGVSFREGANVAPYGIREFSESIESYSPRQHRDLRDLVFVDLGDDDDPLFAATILLKYPKALLATMGGDHSITPKVVSEINKLHRELVVVGFDAHLDLREDYPGDHACTYRRISDVGIDCHVFGPRSGDRQEWSEAPSVLKSLSESVVVSAAFVESLGDAPVYVTLDIDVLDPSVAPGTGNPEPGGPQFNELLESVEALAQANVVAFDVVEVSPPLDPSGITQAAAAVLIREMLLRFSAQ